jgi:hypothetical protein
MDFYSVRDLRNNPTEVWATLDASGQAVITSNGKPRALMIDIAHDDLAEVMSMLSSARATQAMMKIRAAAIEKGTADMTMDEINEEIARYRLEKSNKESMTA